jgi:uncharacterized protein YndB with AHSA1/START domain
VTQHQAAVQPNGAEDTRETDTGQIVEPLTYEIEIAASPAIVWAFWTDAERIVRWMGRTATADPRPEGEFRLRYGGGEVVSGRYLEVDEPRHLVLTWGWEEPGDPVPAGASRVEVTLDPIAGGESTRLRLRHTGLAAESRAGHDEGWNYFLPRLVEVAGSRE